MPLRRSALTLWFALIAMAMSAQTREFPYPSIPDTLREATERGRYLLLHYWDNVDFNDTLQVKDADITEQGFVNFIDLIPRVTELAVRTGAVEKSIRSDFPPFVKEAVGNFVKRAFEDATAKEIFEKIVEHYLDDPNSPMRNDGVYALVLEEELRQVQRASDSHASDSIAAKRERLTYKLRNVSKNQEGSVATDFTFVDRQGREHRLSDYKSQPVVLYFYDPDCENCHRITAELKKSEALKTMTVLAIYPDEDTDNWRRKPQPFPQNWLDGYSPEGEITAKTLYYIQATPSIYLLDVDNRIVLKDTEPDRLLGTIQQRIQL